MRFLKSAFFFFTVFFANFCYAQQLSGRVLTEAGKGAIYVSVKFKNSANLITTNKDGAFKIIAKKLPDTLVFSGSGFETYHIVVTEEMLKDPNFEVVLLSSRDKAVVSAEGVRDRSAGWSGAISFTPSRKGESVFTPASGEYLADKKLFMRNPMPLQGNAVIYKSGLLTAGEVNDFSKWKMWEDFRETEFKAWSDHWGLYPKQRFSVLVQNKDHIAAIGQRVELINKKNNKTVWSAYTDNTGKAELWAGMNGPEEGAEYIISCKGASNINSPITFDKGVNKIELGIPCSVSNTVDIAVVVDATGSMNDEIEFLKLELEEAIRSMMKEFGELNVNTASIFYRDGGDEYLAQHIDFQSDLLKTLNFIKLHRSGGGGDTPEAVHTALSIALDTLHWSETARTRILFLVLDAPPHDEAKKDMQELIQKAAAKGVRIVPVVCSGADKSTEFIMRSVALATNGTYVFLTDNSGAGNSHIKPTTDAFNVELLNALLPRVIKQMVIANKCAEQKDITTFTQVPDNIEKIKIYPNPSKGNVIIESKAKLKEIFVADFTGKILMRLEVNDKQTKWNINLGSFPNATYLIKYITMDNQWGAEKVVLIH